MDKVKNALAKAKKMKDKAKTNEEKIKATQADEAAKAEKRKVTDMKFQQAHLWEKIPSKDQVIKKIQNWNNKISKAEMDLKHKDDNKEVALGTSKVRISAILTLLCLSQPPTNMPRSFRRSTIWTRVSRLRGASATRSPSARSLPRACATSFPGP